MQMVGGNDGNQFRHCARQNIGNQNWYNAVQNVGNQVVQNAVQNPGDLEEIEEVNANCIFMANLQQASTSGTQTDKAHVYDTDGLAEKAKSCEESYSSNTSKTANVSKLISIPNEEFSDDTSPRVERKFLIKVKTTIVTLQEASKFVRDFKSLAKETDESLAKHKALEYEIERLLKVVISQDIMSIMQSNSVVDTSNLLIELKCMKEMFENCIIKKENKYAKLWNDWYKKCKECKYDKISYDKAYNDMQQKIKLLQAQLGDLQGKSQDTPCVSHTLDPLSQKLENENVELEFQVLNYAKENEHHKTTYKNLFDSINVTRDQTKTRTDSLKQKLHGTIYETTKLRSNLFDKVYKQKDTYKGTSVNSKFGNQSTVGKLSLQPLKNNFFVRQPNEFQSERLKFSKNQVPQKVGEKNDLSNPITSNSVPITKESSVMKNDNVISPGMFRINLSKTSREDKFLPLNQARSSTRTNLITNSHPHVITKKDVNSDSNGLSSTGVDNTAKTRRPRPRSNTKTDRVPSTSKSSCNKNKEF
ncbi:hypothetical protein Tco_0908749 [Tanacetum coccineum]|uniref:Uncharacterized protein n=1 Tax=Tanacetum coccineum TaxID=301880 RepID=A0ABQ5CP40_9ASTR